MLECRRFAACLFLIAGCLGLSGCAEAPDRQRLVSTMQRYLAALAQGDPSGLPLDENVVLVENTERTPVGSGLWKTCSGGPTDFAIYAADPVAGQVGFVGVIRDEGKPVLAAIRLKLERGRIAEIDHLVLRRTRQPLAKDLARPRPALLAPVRPAERTPRERMRTIAHEYYQAILAGDGGVAPFADECVRHENGVPMANDPEPHPPGHEFMPFRKMSCREQISTGVWASITSIDHRRVLVADEEMGLVFAFSMFAHDNRETTLRITGVPGISEWPYLHGPGDTVACHIFKIRSGKIYDIEAIGYLGPHGVRSGW